MLGINWRTVGVCLLVSMAVSNSSAVASSSSLVVQQLIAINSGWGHAISIHQNGTTGEVSAANLTSKNTKASTLQVSGVEAGRGSEKITHNESAPGAADQNASGLSIHLAGSNTAAQGIFIANDGRGDFLTLHHLGKPVLEILADGTTLHFATSKSGPPIANEPNGTLAQRPDGTTWRRTDGKWIQR